MLPVQTKTYRMFDGILTAISLLLAVAYFGFDRQLPSANTALSLYAVVFATSHLVYAASFYQLLKNRSRIGASLIGAILLTANLAILIVGSGGFESPYYALWLILVSALGIYKPAVPLGLLAFTTLYFTGIAYGRNFNPAFLGGSVIALIATYISGALGFWLWHSHHTRLRKGDQTAELAQQLSQEQLKAEILLQNIGEGVVVIDLKSQVQLLNPAGEKLLGWPESEAKGIDSALVLPLTDEHEQSLPKSQNPFAIVAQTQQTIEHEDLFVTTRSQRQLALSLVVSPIFDNGGQFTGTIGVFRDISLAKAAERQRNEFISTASHEMRTPVAAVEGYVALALNAKVAQIDDSARNYLQKAQASIQHLGRLFQDLLTTTRIEEGKLPSHPEAIDVSQLIGQVVDELQFKARRQGLGLYFRAPEQTGKVKQLSPLYYFLADPERIREVVSNLIDNALKFTRQGEVVVNLAADKDSVTVSVTDTGTGIAPEDMPHLFQKFYRIDNPATANVGGTGLGLYICRAIIEMYQGRIWVESQLGKGSSFKFSLPRLSFEKAQAKLTKQPLTVTVPTADAANKRKLVASQLSRTVE
ncbi:PAS domain-containing protein [Candidatus Microgenomates bacterium]|nr:PAS domain-containing protein [Candidatus Microgenomates bacterium]